MNDLEKGLYRKRMLSYGGLLKQKHKILNLDDAEDGNLINTSDEDKTTDEEEKAVMLHLYETPHEGGVVHPKLVHL